MIMDPFVHVVQRRLALFYLTDFILVAMEERNRPGKASSPIRVALEGLIGLQAWDTHQGRPRQDKRCQCPTMPDGCHMHTQHPHRDTPLSIEKQSPSPNSPSFYPPVVVR